MSECAVGNLCDEIVPEGESLNLGDICGEDRDGNAGDQISIKRSDNQSRLARAATSKDIKI